MKPIVFFVSCFLLLSCSSTGSSVSLLSSPLVVKTVEANALLRVNSIAVAPLDFDPRVREFEPKGEQFNNRLDEMVKEHLQLQIIGIEEFTKTMKAKSLSDPVAIGKSLGADAVLKTNLKKYVEREGSAIGVTVPASVGFEMRLVRVSDGAEIWNASYFYTDEALSENLLRLGEKLKSGGSAGWRSEQQLLVFGIQETVIRLATDRSAAFVK